MAYTQCQLGGYTYAVNPRSNVNPPVRKITVTDGLSGTLYTDWGSAASRRTVVQQWPTLDASQYRTLAAFVAGSGPLAFVDTDGSSYTVLPSEITFSGATPQEDAFQDVRFTMRVISSP